MNDLLHDRFLRKKFRFKIFTLGPVEVSSPCKWIPPLHVKKITIEMCCMNYASTVTIQSNLLMYSDGNHKKIRDQRRNCSRSFDNLSPNLSVIGQLSTKYLKQSTS